MAPPTHAAPRTTRIIRTTRLTRTVRACALLGLLAAGCFVDQRGERDGSSGATLGMGATTTGSATDTHGDTATATTSTTTTTSTTAPSTTSTTSTTTDPSSTGITQTPTTLGPTCPAADLFPAIGDPACRTCLADNCCEPVSECAGAPGCDALWSCVAQDPCINTQDGCPGYAEHGPLIGAISACRQAACTGICDLEPCAAQQSACQQSADCTAINACVLANCSDPCPLDDPDCILKCWNGCVVKNPAGKELWVALLQCLADGCS